MGKLFAGLGIGGIIVLVLILALLWPLVVIWAVNTLFAMGIAYSFWNCLAVLVLTMTFGKANVSVNKS